MFELVITWYELSFNPSKLELKIDPIRVQWRCYLLIARYLVSLSYYIFIGAIR